MVDIYDYFYYHEDDYSAKQRYFMTEYKTVTVVPCNFNSQLGCIPSYLRYCARTGNTALAVDRPLSILFSGNCFDFFVYICV